MDLPLGLPLVSGQEESVPHRHLARASRTCPRLGERARARRLGSDARLQPGGTRRRGRGAARTADLRPAHAARGRRPRAPVSGLARAVVMAGPGPAAGAADAAGARPRAGRRGPGDARERGLRHRRALCHGRLAGVPYPIIPGHVSCGRVARDAAGALRDVEGRPLQAGQARDVLRRLRHLRRLLALPGGARPARAARSRRVYGITTSADEGLLGGWAERIELRRACASLPLPDGLDALGLHGRRLRTADRIPRRRARRHRARRHRGGAGQRPGRPERRRFRAARGRPARARGRARPAARLAGSAALGADEMLDIAAVRDPADRVRWVRERTGGRGADVVIEACGNPQAVRRGPRDAARRRALRRWWASTPTPAT